MGDLKDIRLIYLKGFLFLFLGFLCAGYIYAALPDPFLLLLLIITIWSFARFYYFAFYVIEHYVDDSYKFAGLWDFFCYLVGKWKKDQ